MQCKTLIQDAPNEILTKVDDCVLKLALAAWSVANAASLMLFGLLGSANLVVAHVFSPTLDAELEIGVTVEVSQLISMDATLAMETINVLADDSLEDTTILKLYHGHVGS